MNSNESVIFPVMTAAAAYKSSPRVGSVGGGVAGSSVELDDDIMCELSEAKFTVQTRGSCLLTRSFHTQLVETDVKTRVGVPHMPP